MNKKHEAKKWTKIKALISHVQNKPSQLIIYSDVLQKFQVQAEPITSLSTQTVKTASKT